MSNKENTELTRKEIIDVLKKEYLNKIIKKYTTTGRSMDYITEQNEKIIIINTSVPERDRQFLNTLIDTLASELSQARAELTLKTEFGK